VLRDNTVRIFRFQVIFTVNRFINMFICMSFCNVCVTVEQVIIGWAWLMWCFKCVLEMSRMNVQVNK